MKSFVATVAALTALSTGGTAQTADVGPVITGYLYNAVARTLNAILGVPGAAYLSGSIVEDLDAAWPSPDRNHAIGVRGERTIFYTGLKSLHPAEVPDVRLISPVTRVFWSTHGRAVVLYSANEGILQIVRISGNFVAAEPAVPVRSVPATLSALAVTDLGRVSFAAGDGVYVLAESGPVQRWLIAGTTALAFCSEERLYATAGEALVQLGLAGNILRKFAVDFAASGITCAGARLLAVDPRTPAIAVFETDGTGVLYIPLDRQPSTLQPIHSESIFLLNGVEQDRLPAIVLDMGRLSGTFFIPTVASGSGI